MRNASDSSSSSKHVARNVSVNQSLVSGQRALAIERTSTIVDTAEEGHLLRGAVDSTVILALMAVQVALVQKAAAAVSVLADMASSSSSR